MVAGQGATATIWTPDLLQILAQGRQVTVFTNKGIGYSTGTEHEATSVAGLSLKLVYHIAAQPLGTYASCLCRSAFQAHHSYDGFWSQQATTTFAQTKP